MTTKTKYTCLDGQFWEVTLPDGNLAKPVVWTGK